MSALLAKNLRTSIGSRMFINIKKMTLGIFTHCSMINYSKMTWTNSSPVVVYLFIFIITWILFTLLIIFLHRVCAPFSFSHRSYHQFYPLFDIQIYSVFLIVVVSKCMRYALSAIHIYIVAFFVRFFLF